MNRKLYPNLIERIAKIFKALGEPVRIKILQELDGEKSVSELCVAVGTSQPNLSKHLKMLSELGLVARRQEGNTAYYSISDPMIEKLCDLVCRGLERRLDKEMRSINSSRATLKASPRLIRRAP